MKVRLSGDYTRNENKHIQRKRLYSLFNSTQQIHVDVIHFDFF